MGNRAGFIHICRFVFYMFVLMMSTIVLNIGHIKWDNTWGNVLGLAGTSTVQTVLGHATDTVKVLGIVIKYFTPVQAMFFRHF